jgi:hypothetical protein
VWRSNAIRRIAFAFASHTMSDHTSKRTPRPPWRHALYVVWALPVSMWAVFLLPLVVYRADWRICRGVLELSSPALAGFLRGPWFRAIAGSQGFAAATIGHVVIAQNSDAMMSCRAHEHVHVRQCERWGALFPLAYIVAGLLAAARARQWHGYYRDNPFEREAERGSAESGFTKRHKKSCACRTD